MKKMSDDQLLGFLRNDNKKAFSIIMDRYSDVLVSHLLRRIKSPEDVSEIIQDIFISFWNNRYTIYTTDGSFYPYLFKAAKYEVIRWLVKRDKRIERQRHFFIAYDNEFEPSLEAVLIADELRDLLMSEIDRMPETMRSIFQMSRLESKSVREIAMQLSLSEQTVKNNMVNALKRLRISINKVTLR